MTPLGPISTNFDWSEVMFTTHRDLINTNQSYVAGDTLIQANARELAARILEPIRVRWGPVVVHSWVRCPALNDAVGGVRNSQHLDGTAADIHAVNGTLDEVFAWIASSGLQFSQVIREPLHSGVAGWVHVALQGPGRAVGQVIR